MGVPQNHPNLRLECSILKQPFLGDQKHGKYGNPHILGNAWNVKFGVNIWVNGKPYFQTNSYCECVVMWWCWRFAIILLAWWGFWSALSLGGRTPTWWGVWCSGPWKTWRAKHFWWGIPGFDTSHVVFGEKQTINIINQSSVCFRSQVAHSNFRRRPPWLQRSIFSFGVSYSDHVSFAFQVFALCLEFSIMIFLCVVTKCESLKHVANKISNTWVQIK